MSRSLSAGRRALLGLGAAAGVAGGFVAAKIFFVEDRTARQIERHVDRVKLGQNVRPRGPVATREEQLKALRSGKEFDVLVVGGGATGAGCALDAITRQNLSVALVEADDFASGTTSRSTKLIHGGVRYLQKAILGLDLEQYRMVKEALHERANLLDIAPHLSFPLPIMLPVYKWWQVPYFWAGIKAYDLVSGDECIKGSYYLSKERALELFPMLKRDMLKGALVYYDGSHNDARMCLSIVMSAARHGAVVANHTRVTGLLKDENNKIVGAKMKDMISGSEWETRARCVINATGPFTDSMRQLDEPTTPKIVCPSAGVHVILPDYYSPSQMGMLDPDTSDGRVIFFLPWQGVTIAGTTDTPTEVTTEPSPSETEIQFILNEVKNYLTPDIEVRRGDVLSAWSGIRPLVVDPKKTETQELVRNHVIDVSPSGLITIAGGKWTTYRSMAAETIDKALEELNLTEKAGPSKTDGLLLEGAHDWTPTMFIRLVQDLGIESQVAMHLAETYGDRAFSVGHMARMTGKRWPILGRRLHEEYPYIEAEVRYACRREFAATVVDVVARRLRLSFLNVMAAEEALPRIADIMAEELGWSKADKEKQVQNALHFLKAEMGKDVNKVSRDQIPINLSKAEIGQLVKRFNAIDSDKKGFVSVNDLRTSLKKSGHEISDEELHHILSELDTNNNGQVELEEFLQMMSAMKTGTIAHSRFKHVTDLDLQGKKYGDKIERSGGGL